MPVSEVKTNQNVFHARLQYAPPTAHNGLQDYLIVKPQTGAIGPFGWQPVREGIGHA